MQILSLSEAKMKLSELVDKITNFKDSIMITKKGKPAAVLISPEDFNSEEETMAIKSDVELMAEIRRGLKNLKKKSTKLYTLDEIFDKT